MWTTTPWTLVSNAAVAVDPELTYVRARVDGGPVEIVAEALVERVLGEGAEVLERFPGASSWAPPTSPRSRSSRPARTASKGHTVLPGDFVTDQRRHRSRAHRDRVRRGRLPPRRAAGAERDQPGPARRDLRRADRPVCGPLGQGRRPGPDRGSPGARQAAARRVLRALLSALLALPHAAALLRQAVLVHRHQPDQGPAAGRQRDRQLVPRARQARALRQLAGGQRRLGAVARALLGDAAAGVALRQRARDR